MANTTIIDGRTARRAPTATGPVAVDVGIVGAGLCGSLLALVLARRGVSVAVIDRHPEHQSDFRCEKVSPAQIALLDALGVSDVLNAAFPWRGGLSSSGFRYEAMVNAIRAAWPGSVRFIADRVVDVTGDGARQSIVGGDGELASCRLAVIASGASPALISRLGLERHAIRDGHSICIGFSLVTASGAPLPFSDLVHPGEKAGDRIGYASFFPLAGATRVNLFTYHDPTDPWVRQARCAPLDALRQVAPGLRDRLAGAGLVGGVDVRVTHLHRLTPPDRDGLVVIGDAFQTSCPSTAFGVTRLLTDIRQLLDRLPEWLAAPSIDAARIAAFYDDPAKVDVDRRALAAAERVRKAAILTSPGWRLYRQASRLKRRLRRTAPTAAAPALLRGDKVRVKSAVEILASLDADGRLNGMPFMPEMIPFLGRTLAVRRRADQTCVEGLGLRALPQTVFLEGARCDGAAHDGCQRGCALFWNEAWLDRGDDDVGAAADRTRISAAQDEEARRRLAAFPIRAGERYLCQSTALAAATGLAPRLRALYDDLRRGELSTPRLLEIVARTVVRKALALVGRGEIGSLTGRDGKRLVRLGLRAGERVRVKPPLEIAATLNSRGRNRGMTFEPEMTGHARRVYTVAGPVERMIHEETGRMVQLTATVTLQGVVCQGRCTRNCPRANPLFWREAWLERVGDAAGEPI